MKWTLSRRCAGIQHCDDASDKLTFSIQNAPEKLELKNKLIGEIDAGARPDVVIASSSSGIPSSQFINCCKKNPGRVLIGHPFNPPHLMPLVEVVPHPGSSQDAVNEALDIYAALGKRPVLVKQEAPGFAANRLQAALCNEAYSLVQRGILSAADVGTVNVLTPQLMRRLIYMQMRALPQALDLVGL